jgi:hypothetical protein
MALMCLVLAAGLLAAAPQAAKEDFAPFVIPLEMAEDSQIKLPPSPAIRPDGERLVAREGHFYRGKKRVRIWGVNLCFGANFPKHADAEKVAKRLADFGINSVRFHHMDSAAFPRGIWDPKDPMKLSAEALDRLDYLIDRLARRGICANINLHVSRTHSRYLDLPDRDKLRGYDKMVDIFTPALVDAQKRYARDLLTHVNKYRKVRYADDPAVAFVEISNEDSLFMWGADAHLRSLPPYYANLLAGRWQRWLKKRYRATAKLRASWAKGAEPLGENVLADVKAVRAEGRPGWWLGAYFGCKGSVQPLDAGGVSVAIAKADATDWHIQFMHAGLTVKKGRYYTVSFEARAQRARTVGYDATQAHEPWRNLGLRRKVELTKQWRRFRAGFAATADDDNARVCFALSGSDVDVDIRRVELRPGGRVGLAEGESIEASNIALFAEGETQARTLDRMVFLAETEKAFYDGMRRFIKDDLKCQALVTGTIVFGPLGLWAQSDMDYIDAHAYWQHPRFPGRPWDPGNWLVNQKAMVDHPEESPLFGLAASRLAGKPFTVSEYNHPAPNDYQAECVPMVASFAAAQDWDGVWLFAYSHRADRWDRGHFSSFFDIQANPAKWGFVPAGTMIFREGGLKAYRKSAEVPFRSDGAGVMGLAQAHRAHGRDMWCALVGLPAKPQPSRSLSVRLFARFGPGPESPARRDDGGPGRPVEAGGMVSWKAAEDGPRKEGYYAATNNGVTLAAWAGHRESLRGQKPRPEYFAFTTTPLDGKQALESSRMLVTACGRCENTEMRFSKGRRTVGRQWGGAPVRIEAVTVKIPLGWRPARAFALRPDGTLGPEVPVVAEPWMTGPRDRREPRDENLTLYMLSAHPTHRTMWYLIVREEKQAETRPAAE